MSSCHLRYLIYCSSIQQWKLNDEEKVSGEFIKIKLQQLYAEQERLKERKATVFAGTMQRHQKSIGYRCFVRQDGKVYE